MVPRRIEAFVHEIALAHPDGRVAPVTHGGVIADFLVNVCSADELNGWHPEYLAVQSKISAECSITAVRYDGARYVREALGGLPAHHARFDSAPTTADDPAHCRGTP